MIDYRTLCALNRKTLFSKVLFIFLSFVVTAPLASAENFKFRARETFELQDVSFEGQSLKYSGLSNTINFWYEKPFDLSYGLAGGSILSAFKTKDRPTNGLGETLNVFFLGLEAKTFFIPSAKGLFGRVGAYWNMVDTNGVQGDKAGVAGYLGAGWEFMIGKSFSLAPELGYKRGDMQGFVYDSYSISVGVHFYKM